MDLRNILFIIPIMVYFFVESLVTALFVSVIYRIFLAEALNVYIKYSQWVAVIWIVKVLLFDVFKLIKGVEVIVPEENKEEANN
jgi:hypothetical protein